MPKAKATPLSRRKSHKIAAPKTRDENDANITFEEFRALEVVSSFTKMGKNRNYKMVFRPNNYARFYNVTLEGRGDDVQQFEYWVGEIIEIRRSKIDSGAWLHVRWLWAPDELQALGVKADYSQMGEWERIFCHGTSQNETVVHSDTIEGPTEVYVFDEHTQHIPESNAFYVRHRFDYIKKTLTVISKESDCRCVQCGLSYNPDTSYEAPLRYCATCRVWCHTGCGKDKERRFIRSTEFTSLQHHAKGLLLSGSAGDPHRRPGPKSAKAQSAADRAKNINLATVSKNVPKHIQDDLVALAQMRIVRPLPDNIAGNKAYVLRAREWIREARTPGGLSRDRVKKLEAWFDKLKNDIDIEDILAPDNREEAARSALFGCNYCGYPV